MSSFHALLKQYVESLTPQMSMTGLATKAGIQSGIVSQWKKGKDGGGREPSETDLKKLSMVPELGLSYESLLAMYFMSKIPPEKQGEAIKGVMYTVNPDSALYEVLDQIPIDQLVKHVGHRKYELLKLLNEMEDQLLEDLLAQD